MFTGKNKENFKKWLPEYFKKQPYNGVSIIESVGRFKFYPFSLQQGVFLEYYRSINIAIVIFPTTTHYRMYVKEFNGKILINEVKDVPNSTRKVIKYYDSYDEGLTEAFKQINEIKNKEI